MQFRQGPSLLRGRAFCARSFANDAGVTAKTDGTDISRHGGIGSMDKNSSPKHSSMGSFSPNHISVNRMLNDDVCCKNEQWNRKSRTIGRNAVQQPIEKNDLPPHFEIGIPSLSPTMTKGNIARWLKKEGDKIAAGEVLCEVETDKATVEMECMEEGCLAKIVCGDGSSGIQVGEIIAVTVEEEGVIAKFKDYTPASAAAIAPSPKASSVPTPPKEEVPQVSAAPAESKVSKPSAPSSSGNRIFANLLARKLAEDHNVSLANIKGTGPDGRICQRRY